MISLIPTIPDMDECSTSNFKGVTENRAEIYKKNKIDPETITF